MNPKATMLAVAIVMGCSPVEMRSAPSEQPPPPIDAEAAVRALLGCDECTNGELQAVVKLGSTTAPILGQPFAMVQPRSAWKRTGGFC